MSAKIYWALTWAFGADPMVRKEFYGLSRRWQTYVFRSLYVGLIAIIVAVVWRTLQEHSRFSRIGTSAYVQLGQQVFVWFGFLQFFIIALAGLSSASDMISREVREKTLGILWITPMGPWRIAWGKWKSAVAYLLMNVLSGLPILALGMYLGGVATYDLVKLSALTLTTLMLCAACGLFCSSLFRNAYASQLIAVLGMFFYAILPFLLALFLDAVMSVDEEAVFYASAWFNPFFSLCFSILPLGAFLPMGAVDYSWMGASTLSLLLTFLLLSLTAARIRRLSRLDPSGSIPQKVAAGVDRLVDVAPVRAARAMAVWDFQPFLWREFHTRVTARLPAFVGFAALLLTVFVGLLLLIGARDLRDDDTHKVVYFFILAILFLTALGSGAGAFAREREDKKWELLLTTPMTPLQSLTAKFSGAVIGTFNVVLVFAFFTVVAIVFQPKARIVPLAVMTGTFTLFCISMSLYFSMLTGSTRKAYMASTLVVLALLVGIPIAIGAFMLVTGAFRGSDEGLYVYLMFSTNPFFHLTGLDNYIGDREFRYLYVGMVLGGLFYSGLSSAFLWLCHSTFNRIAGRSS